MPRPPSTAARQKRACHSRAETYLTSTTSCNDVVIAYRSLYDHDSVVQTPFNLCNELLSPTSQHQGARFGCWAAFKEIESLAPYLAFLKTLTGSQMLGLNV